MASIRQTKKEIKKHTAGVLWVKHAKFWAVDEVNPNNEYRGISRFFYNVDIKELVRLTGISKERITKYIIITI